MSELLCWNCASKKIDEFVCGERVYTGESRQNCQAFLCRDCGVVWNKHTKTVMQVRLKEMAATADRIRKAYALYRKGRK